MRRIRMREDRAGGREGRRKRKGERKEAGFLSQYPNIGLEKKNEMTA